MREQHVKLFNADSKRYQECLKEAVIEDSKENVGQFNDQGIFLGKVGAKKFYVLYKPPYMRFVSFMTVLRGDVGATEDGRTKVRYRFGKLKMAGILSSILVVAVTILALYAFFSQSTNLAVNFCILGFWVLSVILYMVAMISTRAAQDRLLEFLEELDTRAGNARL